MTFLTEQIGRLVRVAEKKDSYRKCIEAAARALVGQINQLRKAGDIVKFGVAGTIAFVPGSVGELNDNQQCEFSIAVHFSNHSGLVWDGYFPIFATAKESSVLMSVMDSHEHRVITSHPETFIKLIADLELEIDRWVGDIERKTLLP